MYRGTLRKSFAALAQSYRPNQHRPALRRGLGGGAGRVEEYMHRICPVAVGAYSAIRGCGCGPIDREQLSGQLVRERSQVATGAATNAAFQYSKEPAVRLVA